MEEPHKDRWSNTRKAAPGEYLTPEDFLKVKAGLHSAWRKLGWIHLRMTNDLETKNPSPLTRIEIHCRMEEIKNELNELNQSYLEEDL